MSQVFSSAGFNGEGRLARATMTNQLTRISTPLPPLKMFSCGWKHNAFLTIDHQLYVCGDNSEGQIGPNLMSCLTPTLSPTLSNLKPDWISVGDKITAFMTIDKQLYVCGAGWGVGPTRLSAPVPIIYIHCGVDIICAIGSGGEFFYWNSGDIEAKQCQSDAEFCDCAAGNFQIFALATNGVLYVTGHSKSCGQGRKWSSKQLTPVFSLSGINIRRIFAFCKHSVAIDENGRVFTCGANSYGQLGIGEPKKSNVFVHVPIFDDHPVQSASLGDTFTAFLTEANELYTCGDGDEYRICNTSVTQKYRTPQPAEALIGHNVSCVSCGCSHIIVSEGMETPPHPGRAHFGLDGCQFRRRKTQILENEKIWLDDHQQHQIKVETSEIAMIWTGYKNADLVKCNEFGHGIVIGVTPNDLVVDFHGKYQLFTLKDPKGLHSILPITKREGSELINFETRSGCVLPVDVSGLADRLFGFAAGDRVRHRILGMATVAGVYGGSLWFQFDDDEKRISTSSSSDIDFLHHWLEIIEPHDRKIMYKTVKNIRLPIEISPCDVLNELALGDFVQTGSVYGIIIGTFRHFAVVYDILSAAFVFVLPLTIKLLRRIGCDQVFVSHRTLNGGIVNVDISCDENDRFWPNDRVLTTKGHATLIGKTTGDQWWVRTDDAACLGAGIGLMKESNILKIVRRIDLNGECIENDVNVSFISNCLPDDVIVVGGRKMRVIGQKKSNDFLCEDGDEQFDLSSADLVEAMIVYRNEIPASRTYPSKTGNALNLSVSSRDFEGSRFLPDDVVNTPMGVGLIVGTIDSNIGIHLDGDDGVSFFTPQAIYDPTAFRLVTRRAVSSIFNRDLT